MRIHNLYSDMLRSLIYLFDNFIYEPNTIKRYSFNLGNRSFQLDYETQYEFPAAIVSLSDSRPINLHPTNIQRINLNNINRTPIIYNRTKELTIYCQEEHFLLTFDVSINCESQFQCKDLEFQLLSKLPFEKWIYLPEFVSFIDIDESLINKDILDFEHHDIYNIFTRLDRNTAQVIKCFSLTNQPMVKLISYVSQLQSSNQRSYPLQINFQYMMPMPQYIFIPVEDRPNYDEEIREFFRPNIPISLNSAPLLYLSLQNNKTNEITYKIYDYDEFINDINFKSNIIEKIIFYNIPSDNTQQLIYYFSQNIFDVNGGKFSGKLTPLEYIENKYVKGLFNGRIGNVFYSNHLYETELINTRTEFKIKPLNMPHADNPYSVREAYIVPVNDDIFLNVQDLNTARVSFAPQKSKIKEVCLSDNSNYTDLDTFLDNNGDFSIIINNKFSLFGNIDSQSHKLTYSFTNLSQSDSLSLKYLVFDFTFVSYPTYGGSFIEKITVDFDAVDHPLTNIDIQTSPHKNYLYQKSYLTTTITQSDNDYIYFSIYDKYNIDTNYKSYEIRTNTKTFYSSELPSQNKISIESQSNSEIVFKVPKIIYEKYINYIDDLHPIVVFLYY
jgi:hypothetical protein